MIKEASQKKVLIAGATGYLGQYLVKELKREGFWVRALVRNKTKATKLFEADEIFEAQITEPESLKGIVEAMEGMDWVFSTVGITRQKEGLTYMDVDYQANKNLLDQALISGVKKFLYVSAINGDKYRELKIFEAKEKFVDALKVSDLEYCIVRPNGFFSDMGDFLDMAKKGTVYLFGHGNQKLNPIHGEDLAKFCVSTMRTDIKEVAVGGPEVLTQNEIASQALAAWNKPVRIVHLPDFIRKITIKSLRLFTSSKFYGPLEFFLTLMADDNVAECYGKKRLEDYFVSQVKAGRSN